MGGCFYGADPGALGALGDVGVVAPGEVGAVPPLPLSPFPAGVGRHAADAASGKTYPAA